MTNSLLAGPLYRGYQYAYPHKTAYGPLTPPVDLATLWSGEDRSALFLYIHVPFCEMRCGFCNLFTVIGAGELAGPYLDALQRQAEAASRYLGDFRIARLAIGGGTPTFLSPSQIERTFAIIASLGAVPAEVPASVEVSPGTAEPERLSVLKARGVDRISIGVETFFEDEAKALGRPQRRLEVDRALGAIRDADFPALNIDLIYGIDGQTPGSFLRSVEAALAWEPEELYLYPLYIRPMTGLDKRASSNLDAAGWDAHRLACYRAARERLLGAGYDQISLRMFRRQGMRNWGPVYRCQEDGMIGLGAGARSYTQHLHYSTGYAVSRGGTLAILNSYIERSESQFSRADYGVPLSEDERRRRFVLMSLLTAEGLDFSRYAARFGAPAHVQLPQLHELERLALASTEKGIMRLTETGLERSDAVGPWLQSPSIRERMEGYQWR
jgi:coproporphyrinogen III oxidase-like Fe-S oxidoreductase